jgi:hypothetical protein
VKFDTRAVLRLSDATADPRFNHSSNLHGAGSETQKGHVFEEHDGCESLEDKEVSGEILQLPPFKIYTAQAVSHPHESWHEVCFQDLCIQIS